MITYRSACEKDLNQVATVHSKCFEGYFLTSLGENLLKKYYGSYLNEKAPFVVAVNENDDVVGFCMGYQNGSRARAHFEKKYKYQLAAHLLYLCMRCDKKAWVRVMSKCKGVFKSFKNKTLKSENEEKSLSGSLLSICVIEKFRGSDMARKLVNEFESELNKRKINTYTLSAYKTNTRARAFYEKMGFVNESENDDSVYYMKHIKIN